MTIRHATLAVAALVIAACGNSGSNGPAPNQPPTISPIADMAITANRTSQPIGFTVNDEHPDVLVTAVISDNPAVVPEDGLMLAGAGTARQLAATPVPDRVGDAFVTIMVTDADGLTDGSTFLLTVEPEEKSMQQFTRAAFSDDANGDPELVNAVDFDQDADDDDFADLLAQ